LENANERANKTFPDFVVVTHENGKESAPESGLKRRVLAYNDKLFLAEHEMVKAGWGRCTATRMSKSCMSCTGTSRLRAREGQSTFERVTLSLCGVAWSTVHPQSRTLGSRRIHAVQKRLHSLKRFLLRSLFNVWLSGSRQPQFTSD